MPIAGGQNLCASDMVGTFAIAATQLTVADISRFPAAPNYAAIYNATTFPNGPPADPDSNGVEIFPYATINGGLNRFEGITPRGTSGTTEKDHLGTDRYVVYWDLFEVHLAQIRARALEVDAGTGALASWGPAGNDTYRLGLGTVAPAALTKLHCFSNVYNILGRFESTTTYGGITVIDSARTWSVASSSGDFVIRDMTALVSPVIVRAAAPVNSILVAANGDVGLGTGSPARRLHVNAGTLDYAARFESTDVFCGVELRDSSGTWSVVSSFGNFSIRDESGSPRNVIVAAPGAGANSIYLSATSNVGINAGTTPSYNLDVRESDGGDIVIRAQSTVGTWAAIASTDTLSNWFFGSSPGGYVVYDGATSAYVFRIANGAPHHSVSIDNNGDVGIGPGAATPISALHIARDAAQIRIEDTIGGGVGFPNMQFEAGGASNIGTIHADESNSEFVIYGRTGIDLMLGAGETTACVRVNSASRTSALLIDSDGQWVHAPTAQKSLAGAPNSTFTFWYNESTEAFTVAVKDSAGVTRTGSLGTLS